jgi:hypothetical protein
VEDRRDDEATGGLVDGPDALRCFLVFEVCALLGLRLLPISVEEAGSTSLPLALLSLDEDPSCGIHAGMSLTKTSITLCTSTTIQP